MRSFLLAVLLAWGAAAYSQGRIDRPELLDQIQPGVTTDAEVEKLLGKPGQRMHFRGQGIDSMEYNMRDSGGVWLISIAINAEGKVRDLQRRRPSAP